MIRNWYNQIPYSALKTKREITYYKHWQQFTKGTCDKPNEQFFPRQVVIQLPKIYSNNEPPHDKTIKMSVHPAKTQVSLGSHPAWSESSLCAQRIATDPSFLHADIKDSDQTGRMLGAHVMLFVLSWGGSFEPEQDKGNRNTCASSEDLDQPRVVCIVRWGDAFSTSGVRVPVPCCAL